MPNQTRNLIAGVAAMGALIFGLLTFGINADCRANDRDKILWQRDEAVKDLVYGFDRDMRDDISEIKISIKGIETKVAKL